MLNIGHKSELAISKIAWGLQIIAVSAIVISLSVTCFDVVLRYIFGSPVPGAFNLNEFLLIAIIAFPLAYCQEVKAHIRVDLVIGRIARRPRAIMELTTAILAFLLFSLATYTGAEEFWRSWVTGDYIIGLVEYPLWPSKLFIPVGCGALCLRLIIDIAYYARDLVRTTKHREELHQTAEAL